MTPVALPNFRKFFQATLANVDCPLAKSQVKFFESLVNVYSRSQQWEVTSASRPLSQFSIKKLSSFTKLGTFQVLRK